LYARTSAGAKIHRRFAGRQTGVITVAGENERENRCSPVELRARLDYSDAQLLAECEVQRFRSGGPGGQHRNKVASGVRLRHKPSNLVTIGTESRLQNENRARALRRLRAAIALVARAPLPERIVWPDTVHVAHGQLRVSDKNPAIHHVIALVLDAFVTQGGRLSAAARGLGLSSSSLTRFLKKHPTAWREVARIRKEAGLPALRA
jgi:hypothetical protein